ncbi:MAG: hypothetical protein NTV80_03150 [Verrucomicrobia bacterium]|nr:hypothetical protein [Verrucomicrobiota bacterium]
MRYYIRESRMSNVISNTKKPPTQSWVRLWLPQSSWEQDRSVDDSFLEILDDGTDLGRLDRALPGIAPLQSFEDVPFLLLLGRPGSGKSHDLAFAERFGWLGNPNLFFEAKEMGTANPGDFIASRLPPGPPVKGLRILIDGLDEALLQNRNFLPQLSRWLRRNTDPEQGRPLYHLAISCRWSDWPEAQIQELAGLWPNDSSKKLILCPLRRGDATGTLTATYGETTANDFWRQMHDRHLVSVACWPQGFLGLMDSFEKSGCKTLSTSHGDAIEDQVQRHCMLTDSPDDSPRWEKSVKDAQWRQRVAGRVAAIMIWSGRPSLSLQTSVNSEDITLRDLIHSDELWLSARRPLELADLDDLVHHSSLLRLLRDRKAWVFQSQVHQEWLAADWLAAQKLPVEKHRMLFGSEVDGAWRVFPVLRAVAAWLARFDPTFRQLVLAYDPLVLLRLDAACLPRSEREEIIEALLEATSKVRYPSTKDRLQFNIAGALHHLAREDYDEHWKAVLRGETAIDAHGTLLGAALEILVTQSSKVPVRDVLTWIVPSRSSSFEVYGFYDMIAGEIHEQMTADDLPAVFAKLSEQPDVIHDSLSFAEKLNQTALKLAVEHFGRPEVASAFVDYWHQCVVHHRRPHHGLKNVWDSDKPPFNDPALRHQITQMLIQHPGYEKNTKREWVWAAEWLVSTSDFEWCLDELLAAHDEEEWRYALVIGNLLRQVDLSGPLAVKFNAIVAKSSFLRERMPAPQPGETFDEAFKREIAAQDTKQQNELDHSSHRQAQREAAFQKRLQDQASACEKAHQEGEIIWPVVLRLLAARVHGSGGWSVSFGPEQKISAGEDWMRDAASRYLLQSPGVNAQDINEGINGLFALSACLKELDQPGDIRKAIAEHWLTLFVSNLSDGGLGEPPEGLSNQRFAELFPSEFADAFEQILRRRYLAKGSLGELRGFKDHWYPELSLRLSRILSEESVQPEGFSNMFRALIAFAEPQALSLGSDWLQKFASIETHEAKAALLGSCSILTHGRMADEVRSHLADTSLLRDAVFFATRTMDSITTKMDFSLWPDYALKELGDSVWQAFPTIKQRRKNSFESSAVTGIDYALDFRNTITSAAQSRGVELEIPTAHAQDSPEQAADRLRTLNWNRHQAAQARAGEAWQHLKPETFFQLTSQPHARLARNADELLQAVVESLQRWEARLRSGDWHRLWDHHSAKSKPEKFVSQEMREWLKVDLDVLAELEVKLADDDRTDILVQVVPHDIQSMPLCLVIEVKKLRKGNAKERATAMKTQLLDRYLKPRQHEGWTHGLYVVAWTPEPGSLEDSDDSMNRAASRLCSQAKDLSQGSFSLESIVIDARCQVPPTSKRKSAN